MAIDRPRVTVMQFLSWRDYNADDTMMVDARARAYKLHTI
jgi:hypothetical protein